jgi:hypothetical protein
MRHFILSLTVVLIALAATLLLVYFSGASQSEKRKDSTVNGPPQQELRMTIPQASWEPRIFKEINERISNADLPSLRAIFLPNDDVEARLWLMVGSFGTDGIVLRRTQGAWSGTYIHGFSKQPNFKQYQEQMRSPRSGWDTAWQRLVDAGLLTIVDASQVRCNNPGKDGTIYVGETNMNGAYRTFMYDNPENSECKEAKQMLRLIKIIDEEFGLQWSPTS